MIARLRAWRCAAVAAALLGAVPQVAQAAAPRTWVAEGPSAVAPQPLAQEVWRGISGNSLGSIPLGSPPTETLRIARLESGSIGDNYGDRTRGFLTAPVSGTYTFWLYGDDETQLRLAPDADPTGVVRVAEVAQWTNPREWSKYASQRSAPIALAAGERYAFEVLHKEGGGGDHWGVGWSRPGDGTSGPAEMVPASVLRPEQPVTTTPTPAFRFASDVPGAAFECRFDGGAWDPCGTTYTTPTLASGAYELAVRATSGGETDQTPVVQRFRVDVSPPQTSVAASGLRPAGTVSTERWFGVGSFDATPFDAPAPVLTSLDRLEGPTDIADWYGSRTRGRITAPATGEYTFWLSGDNRSELWLSTDDGPLERRRIAVVSGYTNPRQWNRQAGQRSEPVTLRAGRSYYVEVRQHEEGGGDHWAVGWSRPGQATSAPSEVVPGAVLSPLHERHRFLLSADEPATFECRFNGGAWTTCDPDLRPGGLADGEYRLEVRAVDAAGTPDPTPVEERFTVDTTAPESTVTAEPAGGPLHEPGATSDPFRGVLVAPATGSYTFWVAGAEGAELRLSRDDDEAGAEPVASVPATTGTAEWGAHPEQRSAPVTLVAGARYAIEAHRTGTGGGAVAIGWSRPGEATDAPSEPVPAGVLAALVPGVALTGDATPSWSFESEAGSRRECRVDDGDWEACASPHTAGPLTDGRRRLQVRAVDAAGNVEPSPGTRSVHVDTQPPAAPGGLAAAPVSVSPLLTWTPVADAVRYRVLRDGDTVATVAGARFADFDPGPDRVARYAVRATDAAGNEGPASAPLDVTVDRRPPDTRLADGPALTRTPTVSFAFDADEGDATFECSLDGAPYAACASPHATPALADGRHELAVRGYDAAGNVDPTPARRTVTVDTVAPRSRVTSGPAGGPVHEPGATSDPFRGVLVAPATGAYTFWVSGAQGAELRLSPDDDEARAESITSLPAATAAGDWDAHPAQRSAPVSLVAGGRYALEVRRPGAGEVAVAWSRPGEGTQRPSQPVPATVLASLVPDVVLTRDATPSLAWAGAPEGEDEDTAQCRVDDDAWTACASPHAFGPLPDGRRRLQVRALDAAGNVEPSPGERTVHVDTRPPAAPSGLDGAPVSPAPVLTWDPVADAVRYRVLRDGDTVATVNGARFADAEPGPDRVARYAVRAIDAAGNEGPVSAPLDVTVDATPPDTRLAIGPALVRSQVLRFAFEHDGSGTGFECSLDGAPYSACSSPLTTSRLPDGSHELAVRARDAAGNADPTPARRTVVVDTVAPPAPGAPTGDGWPLRISWTGEEGPYLLRRDGELLPGPTPARAAEDPAARDLAAPSAAPGVRVRPASSSTLEVAWEAATDAGTSAEYAVRARDAAGNESPWSPAARLEAVSGVAGYRVTVDGRVVAETDGRAATVTGLRSGGPASVSVQAVDRAGNVGPGEAVAVVLPASPVPRLSVRASRGVVRPGEPVRLTAEVAGGDTGAGPIAWDFDDGAHGAGPEVERAFARPGSYAVTARMATADGSAASATAQVVVDGALPSLAPTRVSGRRVGLVARDANGIVRLEVATAVDRPFRSLSVERPRLALDDGVHRLRIRMTDRAGNVRTVVRRVTVDTRAPFATVTSLVRTPAARVTALLRVRDAVTGVRTVRVDGRRVPARGVLRLAAGPVHVLEATDRRGNVRRLRWRTHRLAAWPRGALDGPRRQELRFDPAGPRLRGARLEVLRTAQRRLRAIGRLPVGRRLSDTYDVALLRVVQRFQRTVGLHRGSGTIGVGTRRALDRAVERRRRTWRAPQRRP